MKWWPHYFRVAGAIMAGSVGWSFAKAVGMPVLTPFDGQSQVGVFVGIVMALLFFAYAHVLAKANAE